MLVMKALRCCSPSMRFFTRCESSSFSYVACNFKCPNKPCFTFNRVTQKQGLASKFDKILIDSKDLFESFSVLLANSLNLNNFFVTQLREKRVKKSDFEASLLSLALLQVCSWASSAFSIFFFFVSSILKLSWVVAIVWVADLIGTQVGLTVNVVMIVIGCATVAATQDHHLQGNSNLVNSSFVKEFRLNHSQGWYLWGGSHARQNAKSIFDSCVWFLLTRRRQYLNSEISY